jgi:hypothetical protein
MSAQEWRMSPGRGASKRFSTGFPRMAPIVSATWFSVAGDPAATLKMRPLTAAASGRANGRVDDVRDVREIARLLAVAVDRHGLPLVDRAMKSGWRRRTASAGSAFGPKTLK